MTTAQQVPVGALYGLPGYTQRFEEYENIYDVTTVMSQSAQTPFAPPASFQKTDIVLWWEQEVTWSESLTYSAGTLVNSPRAPYNLFQNPKLKLQGQYSPVECESSFDMAWFQMYRPMRSRGQRNVQDLLQSNPVGSSGFANSLIPQANQAASSLASSYTSPASISNFPFILEWPAGMYFDEYWDLAMDGTLMPNEQGVIGPQPAFVSPQYMGGGERVISPQFQVSAGIASTYDQGPLAATSALTTSAFSGSVTSSFRRVGIYASDNPAELPPIFNWQYRRMSTRQTIGATTKFDVPIEEYGQVLSVWVYIFDPALGTNSVGGYYNIADVTKCQLLYGSNLPRFDDDIATMQKRFVEQHGFLPPQGTMVWDLAAVRSTEKLTNATALNTLTNANCKVHVELSVAPSASAYAVLGVELLVPVATQ